MADVDAVRAAFRQAAFDGVDSDPSAGEPASVRADVPAYRIAAMANQVAPFLDTNGCSWVLGYDDDGTPLSGVPTAAHVALSIQRILGELRPGHRIESGRLALEWVEDEEMGPQEVRVFLHLGDFDEPGQELR